MPSEDRAREVADALGCLQAANLGAFAEEIELREMVEEYFVHGNVESDSEDDDESSDD